MAKGEADTRRPAASPASPRAQRLTPTPDSELRLRLRPGVPYPCLPLFARSGRAVPPPLTLTPTRGPTLALTLP